MGQAHNTLYGQDLPYSSTLSNPCPTCIEHELKIASLEREIEHLKGETDLEANTWQMRMCFLHLHENGNTAYIICLLKPSMGPTKMEEIHKKNKILNTKVFSTLQCIAKLLRPNFWTE